MLVFLTSFIKIKARKQCQGTKLHLNALPVVFQPQRWHTITSTFYFKKCSMKNSSLLILIKKILYHFYRSVITTKIRLRLNHQPFSFATTHLTLPTKPIQGGPGFFLGGGAPLRIVMTDYRMQVILESHLSSQRGVCTSCTLPLDLPLL